MSVDVIEPGPSPPIQLKPTKHIADSGSSGHFCTPSAAVTNIRPTRVSIPVTLPDGSVIHSSHEADLNVPALPIEARRAHIFPNLTSTLISIGTLCDSGCSATFTATKVTIACNNIEVMTGERDRSNGLWNLDIDPPKVPVATVMTPPTEAASLRATHPTESTSPTTQANSATISATPAELVAFAHAALFSPALSTLCTALESNYIQGFPGLTSQLVRKYPPRSAAMIKGHMDQTRKNQRSTKPKTPISADFDSDGDPDAFPLPQVLSITGARTHHCYAACVQYTGQIYTDQTGRFVTPSSNGSTELFVLYDYDSNYIHVEPMKGKSGPEILAAYQRAFKVLCAAGLRPQLQRLDNEASETLKQFMTDENVDFQLVPPGVHRRNAAERAIRTFKNHFIAGLCSLDKDFPLHLWDRLLPQALLTLNLLRGSRINPKLSAQAQVHGPFDYNRTPLAPPGIRVLVHEKPDKRSTWSPHASDGWYVGPATESYRCYRVWMWETHRERIADTVTWFPTKVTMPLASSVDLVIAGARDIVHALNNPSPGSPLAPLSDSHASALRELTTILINDPVRVPAEERSTAPVDTAIAIDNSTPTDDTDNSTQQDATTPQTVRKVSFDPTLPPPKSSSLPRHNETTSASPLRVEKWHPATPLRVNDDEQEEAPATATYTNSTGYQGRRRRKQSKRNATTQPVTAPTAAPASIPPTPKEPSRRTASHQHFTRSQQPRGRFIASSDTIYHAANFLHAQLSERGSHSQKYRANKAIHPDTGELAEYSKLRTSSMGSEWEAAAADEFGRLAQGNLPHMPTGTDTIHFIHVSQLPKGRIATYAKFVSADKPNKANIYRIRLTVGGDRIIYEGIVSTKTADLTCTKIIINSVLSTDGARYMTVDIKDFYLKTPMATYEYMRIAVRDIPATIMEQYNLHDLVHNGYVYVEIRKGMYGLPHAGRIANDRLVKMLESHGYIQAEHTHGLFTHKTRPVTFSLVVDDFGVKYIGRENAQHLIDTLRTLYEITEDWSGNKYCGLTLDWDYDKKTCDISMPGYIEKALQRFAIPPSTRAQHSPHQWQKPTYGARTQLTAPTDESPRLQPVEQKRLQAIIGVLLYYARAVDSTLLVALSSLASAQAQGTEATMTAATRLLNYCATYPNATVRFHASDMVLHLHSDASYLSEPQARSRAAGYHYLGDDDAPNANARLNGAVLVVSKIMTEVLSSAAEAEVGATFYNGKEACTIRTALIEMGHPQPATTIVTDNSTAEGLANDTITQRRSKAIDMRFYWIRDRTRQGQFRIHWKPGADNHADYFTKHHSPAHHRSIRNRYLVK